MPKISIVLLSLLSSFLVCSANSEAALTSIPPAAFDGTISQVIYEAGGRASGFVLNDHTVVEFPAVSLVRSDILAVGGPRPGAWTKLS